MPGPPWRSWKRSLDGREERWRRFTLALPIGVGWHKARNAQAGERPMNKAYPHLSDKLPHLAEIAGKSDT